MRFHGYPNTNFTLKANPIPILVKDFDPKRSDLCQYVLECDHVIVWKNVKILNSELHVNRHRTVESVLINQNCGKIQCFES